METATARGTFAADAIQRLDEFNRRYLDEAIHIRNAGQDRILVYLEPGERIPESTFVTHAAVAQKGARGQFVVLEPKGDRS